MRVPGARRSVLLAGMALVLVSGCGSSSGGDELQTIDPAAAAERDRMDRRWRAMLRNVIREGQRRGEFVDTDADQTMFVLAAFVFAIDWLVTLVENRLLVWRPVAAETRT